MKHNLTQEEIFNLYREYYRKEQFNSQREKLYSTTGGFDTYFQSIMTHQKTLKYISTEMSIEEFTQLINDDNYFYLKWAENLSEEEIQIRNIPTDIIVKEFNRRVTEGIIKI